MEITCPFWKDSVIRLLERVDQGGTETLVEYLVIVPVKVRTNAVAIRFLPRWDVRIARTNARDKLVKTRPGPGADGYARFTNLQLTIARHDRVNVSRGEPGPERHEDVLEVREIRRGTGILALTIPSEQVVVDLSQLNSKQEYNLREILDKLNRGDAWDRVDDLF